MPVPGKILLVLLCCGAISCLAPADAGASDNLIVPGDRNSGLTVENAVVRGRQSALFYFTWPNLGDPLSGNDCALNYYQVVLKPGLPSLDPQPVANGVCHGLIQKSRLLDNGDALMILGKRMERWRDGEMLDSTPFTAIEDMGSLAGFLDMYEPEAFSISPRGHIATAVVTPVSGSSSGSGRHTFNAIVISPDQSLLWRSEVRVSGFSTPGIVVAAPDGSALFQYGGALHIFDPQGTEALLRLAGDAGEIDPQQTGSMSPAEMQAYFQRMATSHPAEIARLSAYPADNGGFHVLYEIKGGAPGEEGTFLVQVSSAGVVSSEVALGDRLHQLQLENWKDFRVSGRHLYLLGQVLAVQPAVQSKRKRYMQNVVSMIDLDSKAIRSRLVPLDQRYLEAAMNAGDAEIQYLSGLPGGKPALLTVLNGVPVDVSVGSVSQRQVLRIHEAAGNLAAWNPTADQRMAEEHMAATKPSRQEQAEQAQQTLQSMADGSYMEQMIAELQKQLDSEPDMPPQLRAQLEQSIQQMRAQSGSR